MRHTLTIFSLTFLILNPYWSHSQTISNLSTKAKSFIRSLKGKNDYPIGGNDTLIDLNGDKFKDILIEYYGSAGTGLKNRILVYLYDGKRKTFRVSKQLETLPNPTFYFDKKIVVGYYVGAGGGYATKLKWNKLRLDTLEYIDVSILSVDNKFVCRLDKYNYITRKRILSEFDKVSLPREYRYWEYIPIIKTNSR